ncbi:winged helix-turn-helix transcriptional regulator [Elizabethkingia anophelis]
MTTNISNKNNESCPAEELLRLLSGKWKPQIFRLAIEGPLRFSSLLRQIEGSNKQSIATALKELEAEGLFIKNIIKLKPLHIEYTLSERGKLMLPVFQQLENLRIILLQII